MGSGSSASKKVSAAIEGPKGRYAATPEEDDAEANGNNVRPCDKCGETRKCARFGAEDAQYLCVACQLEGGITRSAPRRMTSPEDLPAPQPQLRRGQTADLSNRGQSSGASARRQRALDAVRENHRSGNAEGGREKDRGDEPPKRSRRGAKERALAGPPESGARPSDGADAEARNNFRRSQTVELKLEPRTDYRSLEGLRGLREQIGGHASHEEPTSLASDEEVKTPAARSRLIGAGYSCGDRVHSLVSRVRGGLLVLELGHEGIVVGGYTGAGGTDEDVRLLVQFQKGFDWVLSPLQICLTDKLSAVKAAGLPGFTWGTRVRSLVTFLKPSSAQRELWLGDSGTIVGPGQTKGKVAVRFDDGGGEWSMWPSTICEADAYTAVVTERLAGGHCRGDRVRSVGQITGSRSGPSGRVRLALDDGEEGTVIGPGHIAGIVLVHFDSDERVWSLPPGRLQTLESSGEKLHSKGSEGACVHPGRPQTLGRSDNMLNKGSVGDL